MAKTEPKKQPTVYFPTGCDILDTLVGGGKGLGYPAGRIINLVGDKSSGKTFLACELIAASYYRHKKHLKWVYDDCESGFSFDTQDMYGIEIMPADPEERFRSHTVEELYCNVRTFLEGLKVDEFGIYVCDSLDGLTSEEADELADKRYKAHQDEKDFKQGSYKMGKAKYLSQELFPQLADLIEKKHALFVVISQVRENIDPMSFEKFTRAGGKALDFYCHTVLWLAQVQKVKRKDRAVGVVVKAKNNKSKTPRPYREAFISLLFDYGLDNTATNTDFLFDWRTDTGMVVKEASAIWGNGKELNLDNLKAFLAENGVEDLYREKVAPKLKKSEVISWLTGDNPDAFEQPSKELQQKYSDTFGVKMDRVTMIEYIEEKGLQEELAKRALAKWEAIECSIKTNRPRKYT